MKLSGKFISIIAALLLFIFFSSFSQDKPKIDAASKEKTINKICKMLNENYVFPETAKKISEYLKTQLSSKAYDSITDAVEFGETLTNDVQSVSKDKHLRIRYSPEDAKRMKESEGKGPDPDREKEMMQMMKTENFGFKKVERLSGNIGYIDFRFFGEEDLIKEKVASVMGFIANTDAIIFDLRLNGGGSPTGIRLICSYLFGDTPVHLNDLYFRPTDETEEFWTLRKVDGEKMPDIPVYVLTSSFTFSGAEEFSYNLKNLKRAVIVGETTGGGAHPGGTMPVNNDFIIFMPSGRAINPITHTNWEGTGVTPDVSVTSEKSFETAYVIALKRLAENSKDENTKKRYLWLAESLSASMNAPVLDEKTMQSYTGSYGDRKITYDSGKLYYQRGKRQKYVMTPISDDTFMFKDIDYFRLRIDKDANGNVSGVTGLYDNGDKDNSPKTN